MSEQAGTVYQCPDEGVPRHVFAYHVNGPDVPAVGICQACEAIDFDTLREHEKAAVAAAENLAYERGVKAGYMARQDAVAVVDILRDALAAIDALEKP